MSCCRHATESQMRSGVKRYGQALLNTYSEYRLAVLEQARVHSVYGLAAAVLSGH